jgi:hypothetical protein
LPPSQGQGQAHCSSSGKGGALGRLKKATKGQGSGGEEGAASADADAQDGAGSQDDGLVIRISKRHLLRAPEQSEGLAEIASDAGALSTAL